jgi:hypothetical protein
MKMRLQEGLKRIAAVGSAVAIAVGMPLASPMAFAVSPTCPAASTYPVDGAHGTFSVQVCYTKSPSGASETLSSIKITNNASRCLYWGLSFLKTGDPYSSRLIDDRRNQKCFVPGYQVTVTFSGLPYIPLCEHPYIEVWVAPTQVTRWQVETEMLAWRYC